MRMTKITIPSALLHRSGCFYPVNGIIEIVTSNETLQVIDCGNRVYYSLAKVSTDGEIEEMNFKGILN